ncbi:nanoRNase/pAp phosphatase, hydrolyzes c-di-AMP and oligoRNAs [Ruminococcaceae bacterium YRB3002]|nr:nanoRNase/pAp phosphatase, hydrolyzes c-di-AMP and oligoRNAs [Ruminococcaceae bacterium YRB3002]
MHLSELLNYDDIVIQCHDNPDADALASGYALKYFFEQKGKNARFIYRGRNPIRKSNLMIMLATLHVPVTYEPEFDEVPELLITCDCQYGQRNVTKTEAKNIAVIDHHQATVDVPHMCEIRSNVGSCATVIWDMMRFEGVEAGENKELATALYYGLYTDTNRLSEVSHPLDRDMLDNLMINRSIITEMSNSNISLEELKITGKAILDFDYHERERYLIIHSEPCDPNILGVISDFVMETSEVDVCLAYYIATNEIKFSVRSCTKEVHANELAEFLARGIGGGGGHLYKAGGTIRPELIQDHPSSILEERLAEYYAMYEVMYAKDTTLDTSGMPLYTKMEQRLGTVKLADVYPVGTPVEIRTLEGDINITITDDTYLMIGIEGEIYPISGRKLENSYTFTGFKFSRTFEYEPSIRNVTTGDTEDVMPYAKTVISPPGTAHIHAKPLDHAVKLFTAWDDEKYYSGNIGDYIAVRDDDPHDIYIIKGRLFDKLYRRVG